MSEVPRAPRRIVGCRADIVVVEGFEEELQDEQTDYRRYEGVQQEEVRE